MATVVCEKHGLRYDPERAEGCVICRREAAGPTATAARPAGRPLGLGPLLLLTVAIWLVSAFALFSAHRAVVRSLGAWGLDTGENGASYRTDEAPGYEDPAYSSDEESGDDSVSYDDEDDG